MATVSTKPRTAAHPQRAAARAHPQGNFTTPKASYVVVHNAAVRWGVPAWLLWGVYGLETGFGTNLNVSSAGAVGQFQFLPSTWDHYGKGHSPYNLYWAADAAAHYLHDLHAHYGSWDQALRHYSGNGYGYQDVAKKAKSEGSAFITTHPLTLNAPSIIPGIGDAVGKDLGGINAVVNPSGDGNPTIQLGNIFGKFISKEVWLTLGKLVIGAVLLLMALHMAASRSGVYNGVQRSAGKAVKIAKVVK